MGSLVLLISVFPSKPTALLPDTIRAFPMLVTSVSPKTVQELTFSIHKAHSIPSLGFLGSLDFSPFSCCNPLCTYSI